MGSEFENFNYAGSTLIKPATPEEPKPRKPDFGPRSFTPSFEPSTSTRRVEIVRETTTEKPSFDRPVFANQIGSPFQGVQHEKPSFSESRSEVRSFVGSPIGS